MRADLPSFDLAAVAAGVAAPEEARQALGMPKETYPLHDRDHFIELVLGMWFHTQHLVGWPTMREIRLQLREMPPTRRERLVDFFGFAAKLRA